MTCLHFDKKNFFTSYTTLKKHQLVNFLIWLLLSCASGSGFKYTWCIKFSTCRKAVLMSIGLRFKLLLIIVDSNFLKVSFNAVGDSFSKVIILSSSNPRATRWAFGTDPWLFSFEEQTHQTERHFWFSFFNVL